MEKKEFTKDFGEKKAEMSLKGYYENLGRPVSPRTAFVRKVSELCNVDAQTVRNWCVYGMKPKSYNHVKILSELTGIPEEQLWQN